MTNTTIPAAKTRLGVGFDERWGLIAVSGPDAVGYLQNRTTQDLLPLQDGEGAMAALLDKSAHVLSAFSVHRIDETYWLLLCKAAIPETLTQLKKFRIVENVQFQEHSFSPYWIQGPQTPAYIRQVLGIDLQNIPELGAIRVPMGEWEGSLLIRLQLSGEVAVLWLISTTTPPPDALDPVALSPDDLNTLRLEAGLPLWGTDYDATNLLPESGLEVQLVSYTKGCYLGQETVARVRTYGAVQKRLTGLTLAAEVGIPKAASPVVLRTGFTVGHFTSAVYSPTLDKVIALAMLDKLHRTPGQVLQLDFSEGPAEAVVTTLPFVKNFTPKEKARELLDHALQRFARTGDADLDEVADTVHEALILDANLADAIETLGVLRSRQGRYQEGILLMDRLLEVDANRVMAHTNKSIYWLKLGDKDKAEDEKAKATVLAMRLKARESGPRSSAEEDKARLAREHGLRERVQLFLNALSQQPEDALGNFGLASTYVELGEPMNAIVHFEKAITAQPNHSVAYLSLGKCFEATQQWVRARDIYQKGIEVAARRGDQMPLGEMQTRLSQLPPA